MTAIEPTKVCPQCGETFTRNRHHRESLTGFAKRRFCSRICSGAAKTARHAGPPKSCDRCGATIVAPSPSALARRRFCSQKCANADGRPQVVRRGTPGPRPRQPAELSVFGDRPPGQPWRPAGFRPAPHTGRPS